MFGKKFQNLRNNAEELDARVAALYKSRMTTRSQVGDELQFADAYGHPIEPLS